MSGLSARSALHTSLLRAILRPASTPVPLIQVRPASKVTLLDKLHRRQRKAVRQERIDSSTRAASMPSPDSEPKTTQASSTMATTTHKAGGTNSIPYSIARTPSRQLPIYHLSKSGGNKHLTRLRKIDGDLHKLRDDLRSALGVEEYTTDQMGRKKETVAINWTSRQIVVRGWKRPEIQKWAEGLGF